MDPQRAERQLSVELVDDDDDGVLVDGVPRRREQRHCQQQRGVEALEGVHEDRGANRATPRPVTPPQISAAKGQIAIVGQFWRKLRSTDT